MPIQWPLTGPCKAHHWWLSVAHTTSRTAFEQIEQGIVTVNVERTTAHRFYRGSSMTGTFRPGDRLTVAPVTLAELAAGDVVVFRGSDSRGGEERDLVHRIVALAPEGLVARGDNNASDDEGNVTAANLVGRVTHAERGRRTRRVRGGRQGLLRGRLLHARLRTWRLVKVAGGRPYRWLRASRLFDWLWRPIVTRGRFATEHGPLVKFICGGRTVAWWYPEEGRFECRKPYDLVITRPHTAEGSDTR